MVTGPDRARRELIPLAEQQRSRWDRARITEGLRLITTALEQGQPGEYQLQAAIAAVHDAAPSHAATDWPKIQALYGLLERRTGNPMVTLNRAAAVAMMEGPAAGLALLDGVRGRLGGHHRFHAVRGHLLDMAGDISGAAAEFRAAAAGTANLRERQYLTLRAASLAASPGAWRRVGSATGVHREQGGPRRGRKQQRTGRCGGRTAGRR